MKLHFEPNLDYQLEAIEAVCDLFRGQEICRTEFTVTKLSEQVTMPVEGLEAASIGVGNRLTLLDDEILTNLREVQLRNQLRPSDELISGDFTIEMETGTGKTYVYLRTILELNKRYGFTKFIIVVPSIAIKEGVYKSLQITADHLKSLYAGVPYDYFLYDSTKLGQVRNFATSSTVQIMVVTVGAINKKDVNNLYKESEKTGGDKPIDLIKATRPILIVDEPQSVDGGLKGAGKEALDAMNPLCTLRYSATHISKHNMVYRLDAVDAYQRQLVKQIEVASATIEDAHNKPYVELISVHSRKGSVSAKVALDVEMAGGSVRRQEVTVYDGDDLEQTTGRAVYRDHRIGTITAGKGRESIELRFPGGDIYLGRGDVFGDVDSAAVHREMIRRTIREHLDKEQRLRPQGVKVLSLFFIDEVAKYRSYDADGGAVKGIYAEIFEQEYKRAANDPKYATLFEGADLSLPAEELHDGYFSIDKKGTWRDTAENNQPNRDNAERAYNLIMRDKEKLLSFSTPLKFIFSHSALKEGWDNPNVFQICNLRDMRSELERRQTIGRGLRLCVNQAGERLHGFAINTLTVIATESYEEFAEKLQHEIESDTGIRFGVVEKHSFASLSHEGAEGSVQPLGLDRSHEVFKHLKEAAYIDGKGRVQDSMRLALRDGSLSLPAEFEDERDQITALLKKLAGRLEVKNADERRRIRTRRAVLDSSEFKELWDRIKHKTTYRLHFDNERLLADCIAAIKDAPPIPKTRLQWRKADIAIGQGGVEASAKGSAEPVIIHDSEIDLPDILTELQDRTQLTRRSIRHILTECGRLREFQHNPQAFIEVVSQAIQRRKRLAVIDGIKYQRLGDEHYYAQELFEEGEFTGYLKNCLASKKGVYEDIVYDSEIERSFGEALEDNSAVKVYAKLPGWFTIPTPLGGYNPDWAVLIESGGDERLYFVVETKGTLSLDELRNQESAKIKCGEAHFAAISEDTSGLDYVTARTLDDVFAHL